MRPNRNKAIDIVNLTDILEMYKSVALYSRTASYMNRYLGVGMCVAGKGTFVPLATVWLKVHEGVPTQAFPLASDLVSLR